MKSFIFSKDNLNGKKLSKGHKKLAQYISTNYDKAAFMTASKLGEKVGVSESTVVRFATEMGFRLFVFKIFLNDLSVLFLSMHCVYIFE